MLKMYNHYYIKLDDILWIMQRSSVIGITSLIVVQQGNGTTAVVPLPYCIAVQLLQLYKV